VEPYKEQAADWWKRVQDIYPHYYRATGGNFTLFSRYRIIEARTDSVNSLHQGLFATLDIQGIPVQVIVLRPPAPPNYRALQPSQSSAAIARRLRETAVIFFDRYG
jgi:hypothetical protein